MSKPLTPAQAKKRFREFEDQVYNPAQKWLRRHCPAGEGSRLRCGTIDTVLWTTYLDLQREAREPQECPQERDAAPL